MIYKKNQNGFTLIELMITVAIVGILGTVASGIFSQNTISANRTDGRAKLLESSTVLEKCKAIYGSYTNNCSIGATSSIASKEGYYTITASTLTASTFTLTATPVSGGPQANDSDCTSITLTHLGVQGGGGAAASECW